MQMRIRFEERLAAIEGWNELETRETSWGRGWDVVYNEDGSLLSYGTEPTDLYECPDCGELTMVRAGRDVAPCNQCHGYEAECRREAERWEAVENMDPESVQPGFAVCPYCAAHVPTSNMSEHLNDCEPHPSFHHRVLL